VVQASASAPDADGRIQSLVNEVELECSDISASQEDLLARASFLGGDGGGEEEAEMFSTPPTQVQQTQQGQGEEEEDAITMCTLPFSPSPSLSSPEHRGEEGEQADSLVKTKEPRKPRICTSKVRGARIRTRDVDPLYKAVLMIPTAPAPTFAGDILVLARQRGIF
jgi:hypothetical protein